MKKTILALASTLFLLAACDSATDGSNANGSGANGVNGSGTTGILGQAADGTSIAYSSK